MQLKSTISSLLDVNIDEKADGSFTITVGPLHAETGIRMVKENNGKLPDLPYENLTWQEAQIFAPQWQKWIDKQNMNKSQWKKKKKKGGRK